MLDVRTETTDGDLNLCVFVLTDGTWEREQIQHLVEGDGLDALVFVQACELRLLFRLGVANLCHRTETTDLHIDVLARDRVNAKKLLAAELSRIV